MKIGRLVGAAALLAALLVIGALRLGPAPALGGFLDGETDAILTAVVCLLLYLRGPHGAWVLTAGYLRFVYALIVKFVPELTPVKTWPRAATSSSSYLKFTGS